MASQQARRTLSVREDGMIRNKALAAALFLLAASSASPGLAQPMVYIPPGEGPRFGGEFELSEVGPVAGYWSTQCRAWAIRAHEHQSGPLASPELTGAFRRFVRGLIIEHPNYDDLSPAMADAVRKHLPTYWASFNRMGEATVAKKIDAGADGDRYVVDQKGGSAHWNVTVNKDGKIAAAFACMGAGV
jgi:hypothetical protein